MPTSFWRIHSYEVLLHQAPSASSRYLTLTDAQGFYQAQIAFRDGASGLGSVNVHEGLPDPLRENVDSVWPAHRFEEAYEVLRSEKPVSLAYSWARADDDPDAHYGDLLQIGITNAKRPWWEED